MKTVFVLAICGCVAGQSWAQDKTKPMPSQKSVQSTQSDSAEFAKLADQFMKESLVLSPVNASSAGYHKHVDRSGRTIELDALLDDVSPQAFAQQTAFYRQWGDRFRAINKQQLSREDIADLRLIDDQIAFALLELERIQSSKHNPTVYVELIGNALFLPLTQEYAPAEVRVGHVLARISEIPRFLEQSKQVLADADPIYVSTAKQENEGNIELIETMVKPQVPAASVLAQRYTEVTPKAIQALKAYSDWLENDLGKRKSSRTWRLGKAFYAEKFRYLMETPVTPEQVLADAERDFKSVRAEMLQLAMPLHKQYYPDHGDHADLQGQERENKIVGEVLARISDEHVRPDQLFNQVNSDLKEVTQFVADNHLVGLSTRENLKVIPTPAYMRGIYSVGGFHSAPPLEPSSEAQYWVTPIDPATPQDKAESKLREYNNYVLKWLTIHEAMPGHYLQFEHANNVQPETRRLLRGLFGNGPYIEGWATYVDQFVMADAGYMNHDPRFILSLRKLRLRLLANAVLDVRMHTLDLTDQEAMDLMTKGAFQTQAEAEGKLRRAKLSSVQLPTYYVGLRDWLQLRKEYQAAMGPKFSLADFHNRALDEGPLPIMLLREIILPQKH